MRIRLFFLLIAAAAFTFLTACGSSSHPAVTFTSPATSVSAAGTANFTVTVANGSKGVTWSLSCNTTSNSTSQCGTLVNPAALTVTYQAPVSVLTGSVTLTATSVDDVSRSAAASFTVGAPTALALPDGNYVFRLSGWDTDNNVDRNGSPFNIAGVFTLKGGAITTGEQDFVDSFFAAASDITGGTITATNDGNLQLVLTTNTVSGNPLGTETLNLTLTSVTSGTSTTGGLLTWFDAFATGSGELALQSATAAAAAPTGAYAFVVSGFDSKLCAIAIGGVINVDNNPASGDISGAGSVVDANDCGSAQVGHHQSLGASTVTSPDALGRVVFGKLHPSLTPSSSYIGYIIDGNRMALVETADTLLGVTGGIAYFQKSVNGSFTLAQNLSGSSYAFGFAGSDVNGPFSSAGSLTFNSDGSVSGTADFNDLATQSLANGASNVAAPAGSTTVDATGRVTVIGLVLTDKVNRNNQITFDLQLYLDGSGNAPGLTMDSNDTAAGPSFLQTAGAALAGNYALAGSGDASTGPWSAVGPVATAGPSGFTDFNYFNDTASPLVSAQFSDVNLSGTVTSGTATLTGLGADSIAAGTPTSNTFDIFVIDANRAFGIETDGAQTLPTPATQNGLFFTAFQN
jgi:hypothetical protein